MNTEMNPARILIVEDDLFLRELYIETLTSEGYTVENASDGEEGLNKIRAGGYDLVLLDIILPKIDGIQIMKTIQAGGGTTQPNKGVVFLTNLDNADEIKEALQLGKGYIIKSQITPADLIIKVKSYLGVNSGQLPTPQQSPTK